MFLIRMNLLFTYWWHLLFIFRTSLLVFSGYTRMELATTVQDLKRQDTMSQHNKIFIFSDHGSTRSRQSWNHDFIVLGSDSAVKNWNDLVLTFHAIIKILSHCNPADIELHLPHAIRNKIALVCIHVYLALACAASAITWAMSYAQAWTHFLLLSTEDMVNRSYQATPVNNAAWALDLQLAWFMKAYNQTSIIISRLQFDEPFRVIYSQTWHNDIDCPQYCHEATVNEGNLHEKRCVRSRCQPFSAKTLQNTVWKESSHEKHTTTGICSFSVSAVYLPAPIFTKQKHISSREDMPACQSSMSLKITAKKHFLRTGFSWICERGVLAC